jgi:polysaccharide biosynthesis protein PslH
MNIMFLTPFGPSPERPDVIYHLRFLLLRHRVTLVCLYRNERELASFDDVVNRVHKFHPIRLPRARSIASCATRLLSRWPLYLAYYYNRHIRQVIQQIAMEERPDIIHIHTLRMAPYVLDLNAPLKVCNLQDVLTTRFRGYIRTVNRPLNWPLDLEEWIKLRFFEPYLLRQMNRIAVVSEAEACEARKIWPQATPHIIRPGIDPDYFAPFSDSERNESIVFLGRYSYRPNLEGALRAARRIFPLVKAKIPAARLILVGSDPPASLCALANKDGIEVTGWVDDVRPYLGRAALTLAPMIMGGGVKYKILQSLAMATPVVSNRLGVCGINLLPDKEVMVAESDDAMAEACLKLLSDPGSRRQMGQAGRASVLRQHDWKMIGESLDIFYQPERDSQFN